MTRSLTITSSSEFCQYVYFGQQAIFCMFGCTSRTRTVSMFECIMFALWVWEQRNPIARTIENRDANQLPSICHSSTKKWAQTQVSTSQQSKRDTNMDIIQVFKQLSSSSNQRYIFPVSWVLAMLYRKAVYQRLDRIHITQSHIAMLPIRPRHYFESWKGKKYSENIRRKRRSYFRGQMIILLHGGRVFWDPSNQKWLRNFCATPNWSRFLSSERQWSKY